MLAALSIFYIGSAAASTVTTSYSGEIRGFGDDTGSVYVSFMYDSATPDIYTASASISGFGSYTGNSFVLDSKSDHYLYFRAPEINGITTDALHLFGNFLDLSPGSSGFGFDDRSYATATSYGHPHFDVVMNNASGSISGLSAVPVPAAVWLFGSGLLGLAGVARRKSAAL